MACTSTNAEEHIGEPKQLKYFRWIQGRHLANNPGAITGLRNASSDQPGDYRSSRDHTVSPPTSITTGFQLTVVVGREPVHTWYTYLSSCSVIFKRTISLKDFELLQNLYKEGNYYHMIVNRSPGTDHARARAGNLS